METESERKIGGQSASKIIFSSVILSLLALFELFAHIPLAFGGDTGSIVAMISGISTIIGVVGIIRRLNWGLYFLGFSILFPVILSPFFEMSILGKFAEIFDVVIAIYLFLAYRACNCKGETTKKKLLKYSKIYFHLMLIAILSILLAIIFSVLSCAFGYSKTGAITKALGLSNIVNKIQEIGGINISQ